MTKIVDILADGVVEAALATCALAHRVLSLTGARPSKRAHNYPPKDAVVRHDAPPVE
jgi:hypothetical protein